MKKIVQFPFKIIILLLLLTSVFFSWSQSMNPSYFTLQQYAEHNATNTICLSANNTPENLQTLLDLGIPLKQKTNQYLYFNANPQVVLNLDGTPKLTGIYFAVSNPRAMADSAMVKHKINLVQQGLNGMDTSYTGKGVIIGVVDQGIDFNHQDFRLNNGKTRVLRYWDHTVNGANPPQPYNYGVVWDSSSINAGTCTSLEVGTAHGSTVAGMAAGNARANLKNKGAAPDADIIVVETNFNLPNWTLTIADACDYIFKVADSLGKPAVINLSLGDYLGSHDGNDPASDLIESLLDLSPGRIVVCAAGNSGNQGKYHVGNPIISSDTSFFWSVRNPGNTIAGPGKIVFDLWSDTADAHYYFAYGADKVTPNYSFRGKTNFRYATSNMNQVPVTDTIFNAAGQRIAIIDSYREIVGPNFHMLVVFSTIDSINYRYRFMTTGSGKYDAWGGTWQQMSNFVTGPLPTQLQLPAIQHYVMADTLQTIVSSWNCSEKVVSVANMRNRKGHMTKNNTYYQPASTTPVGKLSENSSKGPARNGTTKPNITAAGDVALAAGPIAYLSNPANNSTIDQGGFHVRNGGTSMASPVVAGMAALYLQKCPNATYQQFMADLQNTATVDAFTGATPNFGYGFGKADAHLLMTSKNINVTVDSILGICVGATATLSVESPHTIYSALWNNGTPGLTMTTAQVGTYSVSVLDSAGCYTRSNPVVLGILTPPFVDAGAGFTSCPGVPITLIGTGNAVSYQWQNGIANNQAFIPQGAGTYYVTGTGSNGCQASDSVTVNLYSTQTVNYNEQITTVMQGSAPFNVTPGTPAGGVYSGTGIIGTSFHPTLSGPGSFTITYTITDANGCTFSDSSVIEVVDPNGIEEMDASWSLYPNPTEETLMIRGLTQPQPLEIFDVSGRKIIEITAYKDGDLIDATHLSNGIYQISIQQRIQRFIKH
jgi:subtilisin family serine protease